MSKNMLRGHMVAQKAYQCVEARRGSDQKKEYGSLAHKLPVLILQNGLAQATGFLLAKKTTAHLALLEDLAKVMGRPAGMALHTEIIEANVPQTMLLTRRALEAAGWLKRYAQGVLKVNATGEEDE